RSEWPGLCPERGIAADSADRAHELRPPRTMCASAMVRRALQGACALVAAVVLAAVPGVGRAGPASPGGGFVITCNYSHTLPDDPIVDPGMPGKSHSHDFFGNISTNAKSNYGTMITAPTTCALKDDTAGYWVPTPSLAGRRFHPHGGLGDIRVYYRDAGAGRVEPIPPDIEMIGGDHMATKPLP